MPDIIQVGLLVYFVVSLLYFLLDWLSDTDCYHRHVHSFAIYPSMVAMLIAYFASLQAV